MGRENQFPRFPPYPYFAHFYPSPHAYSYFFYHYFLEKLNERALRLVYQDKTSTSENLVVKNGRSTLANQKLAKMLSTMFRAIENGNVPTSISELLTTCNSNYDLRGDAILKLP